LQGFLYLYLNKYLETLKIYLWCEKAYIVRRLFRMQYNFLTHVKYNKQIIWEIVTYPMLSMFIYYLFVIMI